MARGQSCRGYTPSGIQVFRYVWQLRPVHKEAELTPAEVKKLTRAIPVGVPATPQYWWKQLNQSIAAGQYFGFSHFMLTVTMNEWQWLDFNELSADVQATLKLEGVATQHVQAQWLFVNAPAEACRLFHARMKLFISEHLSGKESSIFGKVKYYLCRYEFQDRGSPHAHLVLWLENEEDVERVNSEITCMVG